MASESNRIAVFYTGEVRTITDVIDNFRSNVRNVDIFAVLQAENPDEFIPMIKEKLGSSLKSLLWFRKDNPAWLALRTHLLNQMDISSEWRHYLENSGSMIEYYQMHLAYSMMEAYEREHNFRYDLILRIRCDCMLRKPLETKWFFESTLKKEDILELLIKIQDRWRHSRISNETVGIFMNSLLDEDRYQNEDISPENSIINVEYRRISGSNLVDRLYDYLLHGKYIICLRVNVLYICRRETFAPISLLGLKYGTPNKYGDGHWFNAECQLKHICLDAKIDVFNSCTNDESKSLYEYEKKNYYDEENKLIVDSPRYLFFLKRN